MKQLLILPIVFFFSFQISFSQKDSILVKTTYDNIYKNFSNTGKRNVLKQTTYNKKRKKLREVYYINNKIDYYAYFFYNPNDSLRQIQYYNNFDNIIKYTNYIYGKNKLKLEKTYTVSKKSNNVIEFKKYKRKKNKLTIRYYDSCKKLVSQTQKVFSNDHILKLSYENFTNDTVKTENITYEYDSTNQISRLIKIKQFSDNTIDTAICKYYYLEKLRLPQKIEFLNSNNKLLYTEQYAYYPGGNLKWKIILNPEGKRTYFENYELKRYYREIPKKKLITRNNQ